MAKIRRRGGNQAGAGKSSRPVVGIVWYPNEEEWKGMRDLAEDPERFEESYDDWLRMMADSLDRFRKSELLPVKMPCCVVKYREWCEAEGRPFDASSRSAYAADLLRIAARGKPDPD
jgi:hypothetical protein